MDPDHRRPNFFAGPYLDRRAELREAQDWLEAARADKATLYIIGRGTAQLIYTEPEPRIAFVTGEHPIVRAAAQVQFTLLGWFRGTRSVLVELDPQDDSGEEPAWLPGARFAELRPLANNLPS
jgi:hypothetical protein